jgi:uncharacterized membrane protein
MEKVFMDKKTLQRKRNILLILCWHFAFFSNAQAEMADRFRQEGKIYVVLAVIAVVLLCLFVFLFLLDKKINKIYKNLFEREKES